MNAREIDDVLVQWPIAEGTRSVYRLYLNHLADWMKDNGLKLNTLGGRDFIRFLDHHPGWGSASRYQALAAMRRFVRFTFGQDHPLLKLKLRRDHAGPQRTLSLDEVQRIFRWLAICVTKENGLSDIKGVRDLALTSLLLDTGLRAAEVCRLELKDVDMEKRRGTVRIKGGRYEQFLFSVPTQGRIARWLPWRDRFAMPSTKTLFVGCGGTLPGSPLTVSGLRAIFRRMATMVEIPLFSTHSFRRAMCVIALESGASTRAVMAMGRWRHLSMVETYSQTLSADAFERFSPVLTASAGADGRTRAGG